MSAPARSRSSFEPIDVLVVTASGAAQARGYHAQLEDRQRRGVLDPVRRWMVIPDVGDRRIGSGGSTLNVLFHLAKHFADSGERARPLSRLFRSRKVLIIHSGGDSRRLPAYAAQGKVFTPLPRTCAGGGPADLFDLVLDDLLAVFPSKPGRVLIAAGDLFLDLGSASLDLAGPGVTGVAVPSGLARASRHGVYIAGPKGKVVDFLQKPSATEARRAGAVKAGRALVDTGVISLDARAVERFLHAADVEAAPSRRASGLQLGDGLLADIHRGAAAPIDLYEHILMALPSRRSLQSYLDAVSPGKPEDDPARRDARRLYEGLHGLPLRVSVAPSLQFLHVGTSREFLDVITSDARVRDTAARPVTIYNSRAATHPRGPGPAVIEACDLRAPLRLRGDNIVTGLPANAILREMPRGMSLACLPVGPRGWAAIVFGVDDDAKTVMNAGGTFGGRSLSAFLRRARLEVADLWAGDQESQTLWTARLWRTGPIAQVMADARWLLHGRGPAPADWRRSRRLSLAQLLPTVDHDRLIAHRRELQRAERLAAGPARLERDEWLPAAEIAQEVNSAAEAGQLVARLRHAAQTAERGRRPLLQARLLRAAAVVRERVPMRGPDNANRLNREAFAAVARAVASELPEPQPPGPARIKPDQVVWVTTPVRIDFAGGWSDTPPICHELGGSVVNAAITLNGQYPVQVMARLSEHPVIRLSSVDLGRSVTLSSSSSFHDVADPHDWSALARAALLLSGIAPARGGESLPARLRALGGGVDLTMFSALPKGSGLGTSSVLGAAILAALDRLLGRQVDHASLIRRTSLLEQMMSTAGGWQDQAGGITPGVKLFTTEPGPRQVPAIQPLPFPVDAEGHPAGPFAGQMLLYYTGQRRLARDILQNVVARYLARDPRAIAAIRGLKLGSELMARAINAGHREEFTLAMLTYWTLKKSLDPGSTNAGIDAILDAVKPDLSAAVLPGAGGGGFILMLAKHPRAAASIRRRLNSRPPNPLARFYDFAIDPHGLRVSVL